jgi:hypothetical protein
MRTADPPPRRNKISRSRTQTPGPRPSAMPRRHTPNSVARLSHPRSGPQTSTAAPHSEMIPGRLGCPRKTIRDGNAQSIPVMRRQRVSLELLKVVVHLWRRQLAVGGTERPRPVIPVVIHGKKKWRSDVADDEEMERQPRGLVRGEFYGKRIKK